MIPSRPFPFPRAMNIWCYLSHLTEMKVRKGEMNETHILLLPGARIYINTFIFIHDFIDPYLVTVLRLDTIRVKCSINSPSM